MNSEPALACRRLRERPGAAGCSLPLPVSPRTEHLLVRWLFRPLLAIVLVAGTSAALSETAGAATANMNDKVLHLLGFAVLGLLADASLPAAAYWRRLLPLLLLYGALIEVVQGFLPYRSADLLDFLADAAGLVAYGALRPLFSRTRQPTR